MYRMYGMPWLHGCRGAAMYIGEPLIKSEVP